MAHIHNTIEGEALIHFSVIVVTKTGLTWKKWIKKNTTVPPAVQNLQTTGIPTTS